MIASAQGVCLAFYGRGLAKQISPNQIPGRTAIGAAAAGAAQRGLQRAGRAQALLRDRRALGALAAAAMPPSQDPLAAGARALSPRASTAALCRAARARRADCPYSPLAYAQERRWGPRLGLPAYPARERALRRG